MLPLALFAALLGPGQTDAPPPPARPAVTVRSSVTIRILQPALVSESRWKTAPRRSQRLVVDDQGRRLQLRTIDFE